MQQSPREQIIAATASGGIRTPGPLLALCIEEMSGRKLPDPKTVRPDVSPQVISSIGNYAIGIEWNDGHNSGIYSFNHLRSLGERAAGKIVEDV